MIYYINNKFYLSFLFYLQETLLSYGIDAKSTHLEANRYYNETVNDYDKNAKSDAKFPYDKKQALFHKSAVVPFCTTMFIDLFSGPRYLPPGLNMNIKLHRNSDSFVCIAASGTYKVKILDLRLYMNMVSLDNSKTSQHLEILEKGGTLYEPFKSTKITTKLIEKGIQDWNGSLCTGLLPRQLIVSFVDHEAFNGKIDKNGYVFEPIGIKYLTFKVNGTNHPPDGWKPDFGATPPDYVREYTAFQDAVGVKKSNGGNWIKLEDYGKHRCFWAIDLSGDQCNNTHTHVSDSGTIELNMSMAQTSKMYTMIVYAVYHNVLTISQDQSKNLMCKVLDIE